MTHVGYLLDTGKSSTTRRSAGYQGHSESTDKYIKGQTSCMEEEDRLGSIPIIGVSTFDQLLVVRSRLAFTNWLWDSLQLISGSFFFRIQIGWVRMFLDAAQGEWERPPS